MKIRIISDLHIDLNKEYPRYDDDIFTIVAGDISGDPYTTVGWIRNNIKNGLFIHGNHLVYNNLNLPLQSLCNILTREYPLNGKVSYLNNQYKIIDDIVFIGSCLYTNFGNSEYCKRLSEKGINDFRWGLHKEKNKVVRLTTEHYIHMYTESLNFIINTVEKFKDKKCVAITHYTPTLLSIDNRYKHDPLNPAFANDLADFITKHNNIKYWIHGHIHSSCSYNIGATHIICNPYGYKFRDEGKFFNQNLILEI